MRLLSERETNQDISICMVRQTILSILVRVRQITNYEEPQKLRIVLTPVRKVYGVVRYCVYYEVVSTGVVVVSTAHVDLNLFTLPAI